MVNYLAVNCLASQAGSGALQPWHDALVAAAPPRRLLLPKGHPDGSDTCDAVALLGDSYLKTAMLTQLGAGDLAATGTERVKRLTATVSQQVSNEVLAQRAPAALLVPGVPLSAADLEYLPTHGRATTVEAAIALVQAHAGTAPIHCLVKELLLAPSAARTNWKGILLELGGGAAVTSAPGPNGGFVATATLNGVQTSSDEWPSKKAAEAAAAEAALRAANLATDEQRREHELASGEAAMAAAAQQAGAQVQADWLLAAHDVEFKPVTMPSAALRSAAEGPAWFARGIGGAGTAFQRMLGAPRALPTHVSGVHAWVANVGGGSGELVLGLMAVTLPDRTQRWFVSPGCAPSMTKARESVSLAAAHGLRLLERAVEEERAAAPRA